MLKFEVKKTTELNSEEKSQINSLFNKVFEKERTVDEFSNQFINNPLGYSYHSIMKDNGIIVGHNAGIPSYYIVAGEKKLFFCNVDTMIDKDYRGIDNFFDLMSNAIDKYKSENAFIFYGFPNDNSYPLLVPMGLMEDIGKLDTYCLPYRIGGIMKSLKLLNPLSLFFSEIFLRLSSLFATSKETFYLIEKESESYNSTRYKRGDGHYNIIKRDRFSFVYKIITFNGIRTAFLIDVNRKSEKNFVEAIRFIKKHESSNFDLILYVGHLAFNIHGMIKIPRKFEPKHFNFTGLLLNGDKKDTIFSINNWDVNLSNYDLI